MGLFPNAELNMRTFLGVLMVLIVSGDDKTVVESIIGKTVLLPCNCSERDVAEAFKWQMEEPEKKLVVFHEINTSSFDGTYKNRGKTFLSENSSNCSVLITNITADDQGKYKCAFKRNGRYIKSFVHLNVSASYNVCMTRDNSGEAFKCDVNGQYRETEIEWYLDGELLTNSSTTTITHDYALDTSDGPYHFNSKLITKLKWTSEPTCVVKAERLSAVIGGCEGGHGFQVSPSEAVPLYPTRNQYLKIIPIMMAIGCLLVLWRRRR